MEKIFVSVHDIMVRATRLVAGHRSVFNERAIIYGVPRGGVPVALVFAALCGATITADPDRATVVVDDLCDSGATERKYTKPGRLFVPLFDKRNMTYMGKWLVFPWEVGADQVDHSTDDIGTRLLEAIGENPNRGGLQETPKRWLAYMREATSGMDQDPKALLKVFEDGAENVDEMVVVAGIPFYSMCEHHMAPFFGVAHIAYIPGSSSEHDINPRSMTFGNTITRKTRIVGLSKIARLLDVFAKRLQVQERMTNQVADILAKELGALGVGVVLRARHLCMEMRGVQKAGAITYTSALRGAIKERGDARSEFLRFVEMADNRTGSL